MFKFSLDYELKEKESILKSVESLLQLNLSARVQALVLKVLVKGEMYNPSPETIVFLSTRSLFSTYTKFKPEKTSSNLNYFYRTGSFPVQNEHTQNNQVQMRGTNEELLMSLRARYQMLEQELEWLSNNIPIDPFSRANNRGQQAYDEQLEVESQINQLVEMNAQQQREQERQQQEIVDQRRSRNTEVSQ